MRTLLNVPAEMPPAVIGYAPSPLGGFMVKICQCCPGSDRARHWAKPLAVGVGLCPAHYQARQNKILGQQE